MAEPKPTLIIGASLKPERYSYKALRQLRAYGHPVVAFGLRAGTVDDVEIETVWNPKWEVDTVTMYVNPDLQEDLYGKILALHPKRVLFNPGTENPEFVKMLTENGIAHEYACTLVLLSVGHY